MNLMIYIPFILFYTFCSLVCFAQGTEECNQNKFRKQVLTKDKPGKLFVFKCGENQDQRNVVELTYLGILKSRSNKYKIVRSTWTHGESHMATNRILVFDDHDKLLGNYYVTTVDDLPDKIESNELIFLNRTKKDCNKTIESRISFDKGIPAEIFVSCENNSGDFFSFSTEE